MLLPDEKDEACFNWCYNELGPISEEHAKSSCICSNLTRRIMLLSFLFWRSHSIPKFYSTEKFKTVFKGASLKIRIKHTLDGWMQFSFSIFTEVCNIWALFGSWCPSVHLDHSGLLQVFWGHELPPSPKPPSTLKGGEHHPFVLSPSLMVLIAQTEPASTSATYIQLTPHVLAWSGKMTRTNRSYTTQHPIKTNLEPQLSIRVSYGNSRNDQQLSENVTQGPSHPPLWCAKRINTSCTVLAKQRKKNYINPS